eukprot:Em0001g488a
MPWSKPFLKFDTLTSEDKGLRVIKRRDLSNEWNTFKSKTIFYKTERAPRPIPKRRSSVRDSYKADPEKKKASVRDSYNADIESKQSAKRQRYQEDVEENRAAKRQRYQEDVEDNRAAKRQRYQEDVEENRAAKRQKYGRGQFSCY